MGDIVKKNRYDEKMERVKDIKVENKTIDMIRDRSYEKDKAISARVNGVTYNNFKKISRKKGLTPNACINMLMSEFVQRNKEYLED